MYFSSSYLTQIYEDPKEYKKLISKTAKKLRELRKRTKFNAIAFRGTSGAALAYPLSARLSIPLICVRKEDGNHAGTETEGSNKHAVNRYVIVDDFIDSGETIRNIIKSIDKRKSYYENMKSKSPKCVGIVLYKEKESWRKSFEDGGQKIKIHRV